MLVALTTPQFLTIFLGLLAIGFLLISISLKLGDIRDKLTPEDPWVKDYRAYRYGQHK